MDKKTIIKKAQEVCRDYEVDEYPVRIIELCKKFDLDVFERSLKENVSGYIVVQDENFADYDTGRLICVNRLDSPRRRRFTIAHELAHYILHREDNDPLYAHRDAGQKSFREREANIFASNILMPEGMITDAIADLRESMLWEPSDYYMVDYIAEEFLVSKEAATVRLKQLGVIR